MSSLQFGGSSGHYQLDSWILANVVQLGTQDFCERNLNLKNDPKGRQFDQMTQAARSAVANIAEGTVRGATSKETEMRQIDVARASLSELACDFGNWLVHVRGVPPWRMDSPEAVAVLSVRLDPAMPDEDRRYEAYVRILSERRKFAQWLQSGDDVAAANALLLLIHRIQSMLSKHLATLGKTFEQSGGFSETLSRARLETRDAQQIAAGAPVCPKCGKPMRKRIAKKGRNAGGSFWSCTAWPDCDGTRPIE